MTTPAETIPYGRQWVDEDDIAAVVAVLRGNWLTQGPAIDTFERTVAERVEARHAVAFANGTAGLHGACHAAGFGEGSTVATTPLSFIASANCARYTGAKVELVDIDPDTLNIDPRSVSDGLAGLVPVHFAGLPVDLEQLPNRPRIVIEDAAHALGAWTPDGPVGNCARSDMTCFSFHPVKPVTSGEGGIVTTNDDDLADRLRTFRTHCIRKVPEQGGWYYQIDELGFNYRLTDLQAALGTSQMTKLDAFIARRQELAARYDALLASLPVVLPPAAPSGFGHAYHIYPIRVPERQRVYDHLHEHGVAVQVHYVPIHHHPLYRGVADCPQANAAYEGLLSLPMFPALSHKQQDYVVSTLETAMERVLA